MNTSEILLTGATGFIGSHFLKKLIKQGHKPFITCRDISNFERIAAFDEHYTSINIQKRSLIDVFKKYSINTVVHFATDYARNTNHNSSVETNIQLPLSILESGCNNGLKRFINIDTFYNHSEKESSNLSPYALSKRQFTEYFRFFKNKIRISNLKLEHVFGPDDNSNKFIPWLIQKMLNQENIPLTDGTQERDFIPVSDAVDAIYYVIDNMEKIPTETIHIGSGKTMTLKSFIRLTEEVLVSLADEKPGFTLLFGEKTETRNIINTLPEDRILLQSYGWSPSSNLKQGLKETIIWESELKNRGGI